MKRGFTILHTERKKIEILWQKEKMSYSFRSCASILEDGDKDEPVSRLSAMHEAAIPNAELVNKKFKCQ